jgi:cell division septal protein FtsQ
MDSNAALVEVKDFIKKKKFLVIPRDHFLFLPKDELSQFLFERFQLNGLDLRREGHTVLITISEKICRAVWETDGKRYLMDETGTILSEIDSTEETGKLAIIKSVGNESVSAGQQVLTQGIVENILAFLFEIKKMPFELSSLEIDSTETSFLKLNMKDGYSVFFDPTSDMLPQLNRLVTVLKSESADTSTYEYIDVRFGERVYIKDRL